ncbi:hypothetical protein [Streptomyces sp. NPDC007856]|uniref:hypothetical protein n=1 Tax=Streptomyces sp. NPDC007856 TaxID=3364781 RepID=UPI0036C83C1B
MSSDDAPAKRSDADGKEAGAFVGVRRRRPPARNTAMAATLVAQAEEVADAGFLGTVSDRNAASPSTPRSAMADRASGQTAEPSAASRGVASETGQSSTRVKPAVPDDLREIPPARGEQPDAVLPASPNSLPPAPVDKATGPEETQADPGTEAKGTGHAAPAPVGTGATPAEKTDAEVPIDESGGRDTARRVDHATDSEVQGTEKSPRPAAKQRGTPKPSTKQSPTLLELHASFADSRTNSKKWATHGANMVPEVWDALRARIAQDRRSAGNPELAAGHYMDVVFRNAPMDADALIDLYQKLSDQRMGYLGSGKKSTFRLGPVARANASEMKALLDEADYARKGLYVVSALVVQLLRKLDEEGPLLRPELPPLL